MPSYVTRLSILNYVFIYLLYYLYYLTLCLLIFASKYSDALEFVATVAKVSNVLTIEYDTRYFVVELIIYIR